MCGRLHQNSNKLFSLRGEKTSIIEQQGASERRGILPNRPHARGQAVAGQMVRVSQTTKEERVSGSKIDESHTDTGREQCLLGQCLELNGNSGLGCLIAGVRRDF